MKRKRKKNRLRRVIVLLVAVNVLLLAVLVLLFAAPRNSGAQHRSELEEIIGPHARNMSDEELEDARLELLSSQLVRVRYNPEPELSEGGINIYLSNNEENSLSICAELKNLEDGSIIASTGWIDPGYRLETMRCDAKLAPGDYHCLVLLRACTAKGVYLGEVGRHLMLSVK